MFDFGWGEILVVAIVVIVVVGPKELPGMLRTFGRTTAKLRVMANDFRKQFDEALKEADMDDLKKVADDVRALNPKNEIRKALSPMEKAAQDVRAGLDTAMRSTPAPKAEPQVPAPDAPAMPAEPAKVGATAMPGEAASTPASPEPVATPAPAKAKSAKPAAATRSKAEPKPKAAAKPRAAKPKNGGDVS